MLVLLDENLPQSIRLLIAGHDVRTVEYQGWKSLSNGELLAEAERAGFDVLLTADKNIRFQQNIESRKIAVVILSTNEREILVRHVPEIIAAIAAARPATFLEVGVGP
jgi:hypothetical protein